MDNPDPAAFETYFAGIKGKKVRWSGTVTEVVRQFGDEYGETGVLFVNMDQGAKGREAPDVTFDIRPSQIGSFKPGQPVTFVGAIREIERGPEGRLLKLELNKLE